MASENSYAQLIDDYENGIQVIEGESFDEYQKRMGGIDYNAYGGLTGMGYKNGGGIGSMMKSKKVPQLVTPSKDGSRPGYRGDAAYGRSSRSNQATSIGQAQGATGRGGGASLGGGRDSNEQPATTSIGGKTYNVTPENRGQRDRAELLSSLNRTMPKGVTGNIFSNFNKAVNPLKVIASFAKKNPIGILASMFGNINNPFKGRGFNPDGTKRTQQEYEDARTNRQYVKRLDKMYARKDAKKGDRLYGKNFSQKNIDMIEGLGYNRSGAPEGILASENLNGIVSNNTENLKPKATITGPQYNLDNFGTGIRPSGPGYELSGFQQPTTITGGMAPNDYDVGNLGINNNDYDVGNLGINNNDFAPGNPGQYATADMINEFGDGRMGNINDEFGYSPEFQAGLTNEFGQSPEFNAGLVNEFGQSPEFNAGLVNEFGQSPEFNAGLVNEFGQSPEFNAGLVNEFGQSPQFSTDLINEFGDNRVPADANQGFQGIGETVAGITNNELPGNNIVADISNLDVKAYMDNKAMFENLDSDTVSSIISDKTGNKTLTSGDVDVIKKYENNTRPTGQFAVARNGGIMGYGRG